MVTLFCFCCDHRNPAGAMFCNACGAPLHLKPCQHCDAINARAAAHCHKCGETFALRFVAPDASAPTYEAPDSPAVAVPPDERVVGGAVDARSGRRGVVMTGSVVVLMGLTATALLTAYFAYRQPGLGLEAAGIDRGSQREGLSIVTDSKPEATPSTAFAPTVAGAPPTTAPPFPGTLGEEVKESAGDLSEATLVEATLVEATTTPPASIRPGATERDAEVRTSKPRPEPARRVARPTRATPAARSPAAIVPPAQPEPAADPGPFAFPRVIATPRVRAAAADPPPAKRPAESVRRPPPAPAIGVWEPPCSEGIALESGCDVRMIPKGN